MTPANRDQIKSYVTYPQLITFILSCAGLIIIITAVMTSAIQSKLDSALYQRDYQMICADIAELTLIAKQTRATLHNLDTSQTLILRTLGIPPVPKDPP